MTAGLPPGRTRSVDSEDGDQWKAQAEQCPCDLGGCRVLEGNLGEVEVILLVRWGLRTVQLACQWHEWMCLRREHLTSPTAHCAEAFSCGGPVLVQMWEE